MGNRTWLADQIRRLSQQLDNPRARLRGREPRQLVVRLLRARRFMRLPTCGAPGDGTERAVRHDHGSNRQRQFAPPGHVGDVPERAYHRDAAPLRGVGERMGAHGHGHAKERRPDLATEERLVALVVGVSHQGDAGGDEFRTCRLDLDEPAGRRSRGIRVPETNPVIRTRLFAVLELRLRHGRAEVDVPECWRLELVGRVALQHPQERSLRHSLGPTIDRRVGHRPVHRQAEMPPQVFERLFVLGGEPIAQLDEIWTRDGDRLLARFRRGLKGRVVRQ